MGRRSSTALPVNFTKTRRRTAPERRASLGRRVPRPSNARQEGAQAEQCSAIRFIDLFCGIGGFRLAFERAGARCVFSSDWDKFSRQTYAANFGETPQCPSPAGAGEGAEGG